MIPAEFAALIVVLGTLAVIGFLLNGYRAKRAVDKRVQRRLAEINRRRDRTSPDGV